MIALWLSGTQLHFICPISGCSFVGKLAYLRVYSLCERRIRVPSKVAHVSYRHGLLNRCLRLLSGAYVLGCVCRAQHRCLSGARRTDGAQLLPRYTDGVLGKMFTRRSDTLAHKQTYSLSLEPRFPTGRLIGKQG